MVTQSSPCSLLYWLLVSAFTLALWGLPALHRLHGCGGHSHHYNHSEKLLQALAASQVKNIFRKPCGNTRIFRSTTLSYYCLYYSLPQMRLLTLQILPFLTVISIILVLEKLFMKGALEGCQVLFQYLDGGLPCYQILLGSIQLL